MSHTPGPWRLAAWDEETEQARIEMAVRGPGLVGFAWSGWVQTGNEANARLICAAPDLLAALQVLENSVNLSVSGVALIPIPAWTTLLAQAQAAIAKARGQS